MISYDSAAAIERFAKRRNIGYPLLSDPKSEIIKAFDILNEQAPKGSPYYGIPHPIIFAIDTGGVIRHRFSESAYADRPEIRTVLDALK